MANNYAITTPVTQVAVHRRDSCDWGHRIAGRGRAELENQHTHHVTNVNDDQAFPTTEDNNDQDGLTNLTEAFRPK